MAKTDFKNADEYLATFSPAPRKILETVRKTIRAAVPGAEEVISYQIPAFKKDGGFVFYYSGFKAHYSLSCPPPFAAFKAFAKDLARYKQSKSTVQFPYDEAVPTALIAKMAKHQAEQLAKGGGKPSKAGGKPSKKAENKANARSATPKLASRTVPKGKKAPVTKKVGKK
jgi:uncharacterized protein YdhG (YjbR/CyaY superfamily)